MSPRGESGPNSEPATVIHRLPRAAKAFALVARLKEPAVDGHHELVAGGIAGGLAKTSIAPLERVKILFQTGKARDVSVAEALVNIFKAEGVAGLFKGNSASLLRIVPYSAFHFGAYEQFRRGLTAVACSPSSPTIPPVLDLLAGSAAGATAVAFTYPLDVARARIAYSTEAPPPPVAAAPGGGRQHGRHALSVLRVLRMSLQQEGVVGLYRGLGPTMWGILPYAGLKFYVYQSLKQTFQRAYPGASAAGSTDGKPATEGRRQRLPVLVMLTFGAVAGLVAQTVTYPLDVVRRRMQVQDFCAPGAPAAALPASWQPRRAPPLLHMPALAVGSTAAAAQARVPAPVLCQAAGLPLAQPQPGLPAARIRSTWHGLRLIAAESGLRGLFAGLSITYMKVIPATAIGFTMYDMLKTAMGLSHNF